MNTKIPTYKRYRFFNRFMQYWWYYPLISLVLVLTSVTPVSAQSDTAPNVRQLRKIQSDYVDKLFAYRDSLQDSFQFITSDLLYWNGEEYSTSCSPLAVFEGYDRWFEQEYLKEASYVSFMAYPLYSGKMYTCEWVIVDDRLLLRDIFVEFPEEYPKPPTLTQLATLTKSKCSHKWDRKIKGEVPVTHFSAYFPDKIKVQKKEIKPAHEGAIFAKWFSGTLDIMPHKALDAIEERFWKFDDTQESELSKEKRRYEKDLEQINLPFTRLTFEKGKLVKQETVTPKKIK